MTNEEMYKNGFIKSEILSSGTIISGQNLTGSQSHQVINISLDSTIIRNFYTGKAGISNILDKSVVAG